MEVEVKPALLTVWMYVIERVTSTGSAAKCCCSVAALCVSLAVGERCVSDKR